MNALRILLAVVGLTCPTLAMAGQAVALSSEIFLEKVIADDAGRIKIILSEPTVVAPGDRLVFILSYRNTGTKPAANFIVTNPLPSAVAYQGTNDETAQISVDGGKVWGTLAALRVRENDGGWRTARGEDATHVRWTLRTAIPAGAHGKVSFRGIVR